MMKRLIEKYKGKAIFKNMFVAVFSLAAACAFLACLFFVFWFGVSEVEDEKENDIHNMYSSSLMLDNYIISIRDTMEVLQNDIYVKKIMTREGEIWNNDMMIAAQEIINTVTIDPMFHSIYVIRDGEYLLKCSNQSYPLNIQADRMMIETFYQSAFNTFSAHYYIDIYQKNQSLLYMTNGELNPATGEKENGIIISVDIGNIMENILPYTKEGEQFLLVDADGNIVYAKGDKYKNGENIRTEEFNKLLDSGERTFSEIIKIEEAKYLFTGIEIEGSFYLLHMLPHSYIMKPIRHTIYIFLFISVFIGILILLLAFGMSNWVYYPIEAVVNTTNSAQDASKNPDMEERLRNTELSSIYQTYHSMVQTLNNLTMKKEQQELANYLTSKSGFRQLPDWVEENYGKAEIYSRVICLRISDTKDLHENNTQEAIEFEFQTIMNIVGQVIKPLGNVLVNPIDREHIAVLLFSESEIADDIVVTHVREVFAVTRGLLQIGMDAGISNEKQGFEELASMYQLARAATAYRFVYGVNAIITENEMAEKVLSGKNEVSIDGFIQCLKNGDREGFAREYACIAEQLKDYSIQAARDVLINMAAETVKFQNTLNYNYTPFGSMDYEKLSTELARFEFIHDVREWFDNKADEVWNILERVKQSGREDVIDKTMAYLNSNYADVSISAQYLADMFHITPSYFSRLFNERTGSAFPDYLATLRMEKAKEMLVLKNDRSIQEICEAVGYTNSSYFTATFKKRYGITPGQFRKNHWKSNDFDMI